MRVREIELIITSRHGAIVPDPDGTDDRDTCMAYIRAVAFSASGQDIREWSRRWAPWASAGDLVPIAAQAAKRKRMLRPDHVAQMLGVTLDERIALSLKTIGASNVSEAERKRIMRERKRERDRTRQLEKRRLAGMADRQSQHSETLTSTKPWEAEGVSRRTWFYRQKQRCTEVSRIDIERKSDTRVQSVDLPPTPPQAKTGEARAAGLAGGPGYHAPAGIQGAAPFGIRDNSKSATA
jgi:hypothetical protein